MGALKMKAKLKQTEAYIKSRDPTWSTAGDGGGIKAHLIGQGLERSVNLFSGVETNKQVVAAAGPLHGGGFNR